MKISQVSLILNVKLVSFERSRKYRNNKSVEEDTPIYYSSKLYKNINAIGKQWIRRFALALSKETLGQIRGKFQTVPIPGESVTLNYGSLLAEAKAEQEALREELKTTLDELTYTELVKKDSEKVAATNEIQRKVPLTIFQG